MASQFSRISYPMSAEAAATYIRSMVAREMRGPGDTGEAMHRIEAMYGIPFHTQEHLRKGKAKTCEITLFQRIRGSYLDHCERQIKKLEHELIIIERAAGGAVDSDLLVEVEVLLAKIATQRGRTK